MEFKEQCWFIKGFRFRDWYIGYRKYHSIGSTGSVEFDWEKAFSKSTLGWFHTHPSGFDRPSSRDDRTMRGWSIAMGRPLLCGIGTDGVDRWWLCWKNCKSNYSAKVMRKSIIVKSFKCFVFYKIDFEPKEDSIAI